MPRIRFFCTLLAALYGWLALPACAPASADFETPLYMEQLEVARERIRTWPGPAVRFEVTDLRDMAAVGRRELPDGELVAQKTIYNVEREYTYPVAQALEDLLAEREILPGERVRTVDVCIVRYDFAQREIAEDILQNEVYLQYDFRGSLADPCEGTEQAFYASWGVWGYGGETPDRTRSQATAAVIDHILRHYISRGGAVVQLPPASIDFVLMPPQTQWAPSEEQISYFRRMRGAQAFFLGFFTFYAPYMGGMNYEPYALQDQQPVQLATAWMMRDLLQPQLKVIETIVGEPQEPGTRPRLHVEPVYIGIAGEDIALVKARARLIWPNGAVVFDQVMDGSCEPSPVTRCSVYQQIETISQKLRNDLPEIIAQAKAVPPQPGAAPQNTDASNSSAETAP